MNGRESLPVRDLVGQAFESLRTRRLRFALTAASMAAAVAAVILVATVAATGSKFVISQIEGVGSNLVYAYYEAGGNVSAAESDYVNLADVDAVRSRLGNLATAVAGVTSSWDSITVNGTPMQIRILGSSEEYRAVRNLRIHAGRFLEEGDLASRAKVCLVTPELALQLFGGTAPAVGRTIKAHGLEFLVVGVFSEGVETFGQSEVSENSVLVPSTVLRYFQEVERVDPLYVAVRMQAHVEDVAGVVRDTLESRHRPGSLYRVETLSSVLRTARQILFAMSLAMVLVASITLAVSGVFIMNMMLIAVSERTAEIGIRMAAGATRREIRFQFLAEAVAIAAVGGACGLIAGLVLPWAASELWPTLPITTPIEWIVFSVIAAPGAGALFGLLPAVRASKLDPVEALRHE